MKILYDCFSCSPYYGSDEGIGWAWPFYMSQYHDIWALVRNDRRADIEDYCKKNNFNGVHFIYCDIPDSLNFYYKHKKKGKNGTLDFLLYQYMWQFVAYKAAKKLHKKIKFDLVHHVCTNDFRILGKMYKLDIPLIIGPIGGAQQTPSALQYYVRYHKKSEDLRLFFNKLFSSCVGYKQALNKASKIYFSNYETLEYLSSKIKDKSKCQIMTEVACPVLPEPKIWMKKEQVTFLWAGRMDFRKGLELLFEAIKALQKNDTWKVILCGSGKESEYYRKIISAFNLSDNVTLVGQLAYSEMSEWYKKADVFVFPSLRETTGTVIIEAMSHSLPVICLKQGGGALIVTDECGFPISGTTKEEYIINFRDAMLKCIEDYSCIKAKGIVSYNKIKEKYMWQHKIESILPVYEEIVNSYDKSQLSK